ncbi:hypothetical protein SIN8267_00336 [Sinobacterium norvegicum]|uniref:N-acetyltransferase domain-containing protein n=1 Tax=Sinobacterium norvegicum TaxID=1641715 RepID=A0ABN8EE29_9GAMM|nr:GNAT family N-acetyltransferase [Sinobacterium norvegicum]CAH0990244.1 hypothetical protein SIN8267_00336 [Sinobacterium norvegicum]
MKRTTLDHLLNPQSVALFGASNRPNTIGTVVLSSIMQAQPNFPVYPINPRHEFLHGLPCYYDLKSVKGSVELAIVATSIKNVPDILKVCGKAGIKAVMVLSPTAYKHRSDKSSTFDKIRRLVKQYDIKLLGPGCFGVQRPQNNFSAWLGVDQAKPGKLALVSESGGVCSSLIDWATQQDIGFSQVIALGHAADLDIGDILDYLINDPSTHSILLYLEHMTPARKLLSSLRAAASIKPVILLTAQTEVEYLHDATLTAALQRAGVIRAYRLNDLIAAAQVLMMGKKLRSDGLGIIGNGRGINSLAVQRARRLKIELYQPAEPCLKALAATLPKTSKIGNPVNIYNDVDEAHIIAAAETLLADKTCSAVLILIAPTSVNNATKLAHALIDLYRRQRKPVLVCLLGGDSVEKARRMIDDVGMACFKTPESAIEGYSFLLSFYRNQQLLLQTPGSSAFETSTDLQQASQQLDHKIKQGGSLTNPQFKTLLANFHIDIDTIASSLVFRGLPLQLEMRPDSEFGPAIHVFIAGTQIRAATMLPPLNPRLLQSFFAKLQLPINSSNDHLPLQQLLLQISDMVCELPQIERLLLSHQTDANSASEAVVLKRSATSAERYQHLAIHPYPNQLRSHFTTRSGDEIYVRPMRAEDADMEQSFVAQLSEETRYLRFMQNLKVLPPLWLARFTQIDYQREMALIALLRDGDEVTEVGVVRYTNSSDGYSCEFAIVVADKWQGQGVARYLMNQIIAIARDRGFKEMVGVVLRENHKMKKFCKSFGFVIGPDPDDETLVMARLQLSG